MYRLINEGQFPAPISLTQKAVAWLASEIDAWIDSRVRASRTANVQQGGSHDPR